VGDTRHPLVGQWSIDLLYSPGAQEDTLVTFRADGTGALELVKYGLHEVEPFRWRPVGEDAVAVESSESDELKCERLGFRLQAQQVPLRETVDVVDFSEPLWWGDSRFARYTFDAEARPRHRRKRGDAAMDNPPLQWTGAAKKQSWFRRWFGRGPGH
jgi:hypothetical protein